MFVPVYNMIPKPTSNGDLSYKKAHKCGGFYSAKWIPKPTSNGDLCNKQAHKCDGL
jgi:hypothetical protein